MAIVGVLLEVYLSCFPLGSIYLYMAESNAVAAGCYNVSCFVVGSTSVASCTSKSFVLSVRPQMEWVMVNGDFGQPHRDTASCPLCMKAGTPLSTSSLTPTCQRHVCVNLWACYSVVIDLFPESWLGRAGLGRGDFSAGELGPSGGLKLLPT